MTPTATDRLRSTLSPNLAIGEVVAFAYDTFCSNKVRFMLTALGMVIGTASLILVVTVGLTARQYVFNLIQGIGANLIWVEYKGGGQGRISNSTPDPLTVGDVEAVRQSVSSIVAVSPVVQLKERVSLPGKERDLLILGVYPEYARVRSLVVVAGRFFDSEDSMAHNKVGVITQTMAIEVYGSNAAAIGQTIKLTGLPFTIIGTFRERVDTFGETEVADSTMLIPFTVSQYFTERPDLQMAYFTVRDSSQVASATVEVGRVLRSRHRSESVYDVQNLTHLLEVADQSATALTWMLLVISAVTLLVSGIGIMNIMLATVTSRIREIGIRKAIGATNREIRYQFLAEAVLISLIGGVVGIVVGLALPYSVRFLTNYRIPISGLSAIIAIIVSSLVGIIFGTVPATRASRFDPVESLRYE